MQFWGIAGLYCTAAAFSVHVSPGGTLPAGAVEAALLGA
jgi:hypothetical protein